MTKFVRNEFQAFLLAAFALSGVLAVAPTDAAAQEAASPEATAPDAAGPDEAAPEPDSVFDLASPDEPPLFDEPATAIEAFKAALAADNFAAVAKLLGLDGEKLKADEGVMENYQKIREGAARQVVVREHGDRVELEIGRILWPLPFPITKGDDGKWAFDTYAGIEEVIRRRIGENEIEAMATARAYVEAQIDYASEDRDEDGVLEYAQKIISSEGQTDGLYWPAEQGDGDSPAAAALENDPKLTEGTPGEGYYGYRFRILTAQGRNIAGGAYDYVINGNMTAGFALVAWPVKYGETGVQTFVVNQSGIVYETDLGPSTEAIVPFIEAFNPDDRWTVSEETN